MAGSVSDERAKRIVYPKEAPNRILFISNVAFDPLSLCNSYFLPITTPRTIITNLEISSLNGSGNVSVIYVRRKALTILPMVRQEIIPKQQVSCITR